MSSFRETKGAVRWAGPAPKSSGVLSVERVVALLTPVFSAAAGLLVTYVAKTVPGVHLAAPEVAALFIAGVTAAAAAALKWLHGRQKFVNFTTDSEHIVQEVVRQLQAAGTGAPLVDIEQALREHEATIINALGKAVHAPPSAEEIAIQLVQRLWPQHAAVVAS